ncbi:hypothetical protein BS17DRAFT_818287 [Gyrodon lividus]|nr:hypothetical protein BS17DRAFT_818287 [Gyrodon lividus]
MPDKEAISWLLNSIDVSATMAAFYANAPNLTHLAVSTSLSSHPHNPPVLYVLMHTSLLAYINLILLHPLIHLHFYPSRTRWLPTGWPVFWHTINHTQWNTDDMLHHVWHGVAKTVPPSLHHAKHPPVTIEALTILCNGLDLSLPLDAAVWVVASIAIWCCCHLEKLVIPSLNLYLPTKHVSWVVLPLIICTPTNLTHFSSFHIPWTKTTKKASADISIITCPHDTCPLASILNHGALSSAPL